MHENKLQGEYSELLPRDICRRGTIREVIKWQQTKINEQNMFF